MLVGRVAGLWRYPVKSLQGRAAERLELGADGVPGDRGSALKNAATGEILSAKRHPALLFEDAEAFLKEGSAALERLSENLGFPLALEDSGPYFDDKPIHLVSTAALASLARLRPGPRYDPRRFRPNILVETSGGEDFPESAWVGRLLKIGSAVLEIVKPTKRCVMTTHEQPAVPGQAGLAKAPAVMRNIVETAGALGVYARVETIGTTTMGDPVEVL